MKNSACALFGRIKLKSRRNRRVVRACTGTYTCINITDGNPVSFWFVNICLGTLRVPLLRHVSGTRTPFCMTLTDDTRNNIEIHLSLVYWENRARLTINRFYFVMVNSLRIRLGCPSNFYGSVFFSCNMCEKRIVGNYYNNNEINWQISDRLHRAVLQVIRAHLTYLLSSSMFYPSLIYPSLMRLRNCAISCN